MRVLELVQRHRRTTFRNAACTLAKCHACHAHHIDKVRAAIERDEPIVFVLPAFPGKSPNPAKVLGPRPDMAEQQSLAFLNDLCLGIKTIHAPGARIILCSDGRVFSDAVGISERDVTIYRQDLSALIAEIGADHIATFDLDDVFVGSGFDEMRTRLMRDYGEAIDGVRSEVRSDADARRLYCGLTRFLLEDAMRPGQTLSKTALQKECRQRAYKVIQRSRAWDALLAERFPQAIRLSIHPQACGGRKIGIHLMETADAWLTPWHCVAVEIQGRFRLMKRRQVESLDAELIFRDGRPSHYVLAAMPEEAPTG